MTYAVLRLRSPRSKSVKMNDTLKSLRINKINHCTVVGEDKATKGMLNKIKDVVTWGELDKDTLADMLKYRSNLDGGLTDEKVDEETDFESVEDFAEAVLAGEAEITDIAGLQNLFRMHPPKGGYRSVKKPYNTGGSLGYRGEDINRLLERMLGPEINE